MSENVNVRIGEFLQKKILEVIEDKPEIKEQLLEALAKSEAGRDSATGNDNVDLNTGSEEEFDFVAWLTGTDGIVSFEDPINDDFTEKDLEMLEEDYPRFWDVIKDIVGEIQ